MKALGLTLKKSIILGSCVSFVVLAGTFSDMKFNSADFMNDEDIKIVKRLDDSLERNVASSLISAPKHIDFPVDENYDRVKGMWNIFKYTYDFGAGEKMDLNVHLELVGDALIKVTGVDGEEFLYQVTSDNGETIRMAKEVEGGHEILDLRKVEIKEEVEIAEEIAEVEREEESEVRGLQLEDNLSLDLYKVTDANGNEIKNISGSMELNGNQISSLLVEVNDKVIDISYADLRTGGIFNFNAMVDGEPVSARLSNDGSKGKFRVRVFSGEFEGLILKFATVEELPVVKEAVEVEIEEIAEEEIEEAEELEEIDGVKVFDRNKTFAAEDEELDDEEVSEEDMEVEALDNGFAF